MANVPAASGYLCVARMRGSHRADDSATIPKRRETSLKRPLRGLPSLLIIAHVTQILSRAIIDV